MLLQCCDLFGVDDVSGLVLTQAISSRWPSRDLTLLITSPLRGSSRQGINDISPAPAASASGVKLIFLSCR